MRNDFPSLKDSAVAYVDNASTAQKPQVVVDAVRAYYEEYGANVHRGVYDWSERASSEYEAVRDQVARFIHAAEREEVIFTSGTTAGLNMAARMLATGLNEDDEIVVTRLEHHANLIPWQMVARESGATLKWIETTDDDDLLDMDSMREVIGERTRIVALTHISNVSGTIAPVKEVVAAAHAVGALVVLDAAQSVPHMPVDVQALGVDMMAFSAHKMCGPTGVGVLYGRRELLESLEPVHGGGSMIDTVEMDSATWAPLPLRLEPGTPNIAGVLGFGAALTYLEQIGMDTVEETVAELHEYMLVQLRALDGVHVHGPQDLENHSAIVSFAVDGIHPHDVASGLNQVGVAVRAGHHCAQPLMKKWNVPATVRASLYLYNTREDIDRLIAGIKQTQQLFAQ